MSQIDPLRAGLEQALGAQYEIIRLLGRGGMGAVYLAQERALERAVAIKVLPPEIATSAEAQERFRREARTAAKLTHPNIVPLHTFGEVEGMMYFVMGYVRGESLADRIRREETIPSDEVRRILGDMADALDYAHRQGVIHRDIKPDNILLEEESGRPMLTDFGIAKASASGETLTELGTAIGTPQYMSPEQASGEREIDGRSDLYSLGIVGYAMLSGRAPFDGTSAQEILVQHVTKAPPALGTVASNAPADLAKAITRCLAKAPDARWPDGASLREAVADTGQAEEAVLEKRAWFDGVFMGQLAPTGYFLALLLIFLGSIVTGSFSISTTSVEEAGAIGVLALMVVFPVSLMVLLSVPVVIAAVVTVLRNPRLQMAQLRPMLLRQPTWWRGWYSLAYRHPATGARWPRLPVGIRALQALYDISGFMLVLGYLPAVLAMLGESFTTESQTPVLEWPFLGSLDVRLLYGPLETAVVAVCLIGYAAGVVWAMRRGLTYREANRLVNGRALAPTYEASAFWKRPHIARLLRPEVSVSDKPASEPETPNDYRVQIEEAARELSGTAGELGGEAVGAAGQLSEQLAAVDHEIEKLARDADPAEIPRLEEKLAALGDPGGESAAGRQMRELLSGQLKLMRQLTESLEQATDRRSHLLEMLNTLWLQVGNLRAEAARESLESHEVTGKIRALCEEIERHTDATGEVDQLIAPPETE